MHIGVIKILGVKNNLVYNACNKCYKKVNPENECENLECTNYIEVNLFIYN